MVIPAQAGKQSRIGTGAVLNIQVELIGIWSIDAPACTWRYAGERERLPVHFAVVGEHNAATARVFEF
jgi:hypothetical protein